MAVSIGKRDMKAEDENFSVPSKSLKFNNADDNRLSSFLSWCAAEGVTISSKVISVCTYEGAWSPESG